MGSEKFKLDLTDVWALAKTSLFVGAAAALTFFGENLANLDLGSTGVLFVPVVAVGIDAIVKWLKNNKGK